MANQKHKQNTNKNHKRRNANPLRFNGFTLPLVQCRKLGLGKLFSIVVHSTSVRQLQLQYQKDMQITLKHVFFSCFHTYFETPREMIKNIQGRPQLRLQKSYQFQVQKNEPKN